MPVQSPAPQLDTAATVLAVGAAAAPSLLAYNLSPSPTFLNQALALGLWAAFVLACAPQAARTSDRGAWLLPGALALLAVGVLWSWLPGALPSSLALSALGMLAAAAVMAAAGAAARRDRRAPALFAAFAGAWVIAGVLNVLVGMVQVFAPELADGRWIASSNLPGRAVGNLRQPNHLSSLLLWSAIAAVALVELGAMSRRLAAFVGALFVFGVVLSASRTGVLSVLLLAVWGALDRRLAARTRWMLLAAPLVYALAWVGMDQWAKWSQGTFGGAVRMAEDAAAGADVSSARFVIWSHTWQLIRESPWTGVGFGEFNFAWTLTPLTQRPKAYFDHTHNLPLHLAVELGLPLAAAVMALLLAAVWRSARQGWGAGGGTGSGAGNAAGLAADPAAIGVRAGAVMIVMIGLHSLLEYPLWYAYFLLPAAWVWGFAAGAPRAAAADGGAGSTPPPPPRPSLAIHAGAAAVVLGAALAIVDYTRVVVIFDAGADDVPLAERIERGRRSVLFSHHADYAAVTSGVGLRDAGASFADTTHYLLDGRLMIAWAEWLEARGRPDLARPLLARLREFRTNDAAEYFAVCTGEGAGAGASAGQAASAPAAAASGRPLPIQCQPPPAEAPPWREYLKPLR